MSRHTKRPSKARSCDGKVKHATQEAAGREARKARDERGTRRTKVYRCRFCKGWHWASNPR